MKATVFKEGINDSDYVTQKFETYFVDGKKKQRQSWICPFYQTWYSMMRRCYSSVLHKNRPTYIDCSVVPEWKRFMTFKEWMLKQDWQGNVLDKDILVKRNKVYGPDTCVFVTQETNSFTNEHTRVRGDYPLGVSWHKRDEVYTATCNDGSGKIIHLGYHDDPNSAHRAWLNKKLELAKVLALKQNDNRVAQALVSRYNVEIYE